MSMKRVLVLSVAAVVVGGVAASVALAQPEGEPGYSVQSGTSESPFGYVASPPASGAPTVTVAEAVRMAGGGEPRVLLAHVRWAPEKVDADAWLVTYPDACTPLFGPGPPDGTADSVRSNWAIGDATKVIDATTGATLFQYSRADGSKDPSVCDEPSAG